MDGFELVPDPAMQEPISLEIYRAYDDGPCFTIFIKRIPVKVHRRIFNQLDKIQNPNSKFAQSEVDRIEREFLETVVDRWEGATPANWRCIARDGKMPVIKDDSGADITEAVNHGKHSTVKQIPFSIGNLFYLYRNSWQDMFGQRISLKAKAGAEIEIEKEEELKKSSEE